ncbi:MAG: hypothetical protein HC831_21360 [Chloroflexia bacterium]|nr:hypothetical protein [Chloroflexia bacterium]
MPEPIVNQKNVYSDDIDFEIEYTNEEMNLVSKPINKKEISQQIVEEEEEEITSSYIQPKISEQKKTKTLLMKKKG